MDGRRTAVLAGAVGVLAAANVLNNRLAPRLAPLTSVAATGALLALARRSGLSWAELGFTERRRGLRIGGALAAAVTAAYGAGVTMPVTRRFFHDERALSLSRARVLEEALLQVPVGTVLLEEVGFRGVLYGLLARSCGVPAATAVSSALFGLWHVLPSMDMAVANPALSGLATGEGPAQAPAEGVAREDAPGNAREDAPGSATPPDAALLARVVAGSVVSTGLAGVLFCELRRRGGLTAPALLHVATNSLGYLFARLAARRSAAARRRAPHPAGPGSGR
ncbi:CPBP family intramembrane glutamic endopeptidase [Planomonospora corallina]|uniref:CPBP family intramembrane glutamic endopeptidase n=1 Tax=Planomonospora corallina TaxID=1806052 RepID=A0ABV8I170_9ACTN